MPSKICISCSKPIANDPGGVEFPCPNCRQVTIVRCSHCRRLAAQYTCPKCGFVGPN